MIGEMTQNLETKIESQLNSLDTMIEKMQESFKKEPKEIKKSQYINNNAINEIKNTLEGTNSIITETENRISEVEDQIRSVAQSCPTLCDPMIRSTPDLSVHHQLPEFT